MHFVNIDKPSAMGLKPLVHLHSTNPFTEVNGNKDNRFQVCCNFIAVSFS